MKIKLVWVHTACDHCRAAGLRVLVPEREDGTLCGKEFPALCRSCFERPEIKARLEADVGEQEGASSP